MITWRDRLWLLMGELFLTNKKRMMMECSDRCMNWIITCKSCALRHQTVNWSLTTHFPLLLQKNETHEKDTQLFTIHQEPQLRHLSVYKSSALLLSSMILSTNSSLVLHVRVVISLLARKWLLVTLEVVGLHPYTCCLDSKQMVSPN